MAKPDDAQISIVIFTPINTVLMVNDNLMRNMRFQRDPDLVLPSMYRRAKLIVNESDEIAVIRQEV